MSWDSTLNLAAYADVEAESNYATPESLRNYRALLLQKSVPVADFIGRLPRKNRKLHVLELCSGSSRLLYALNERGILAEGYGVEVSQSRHEFAETWKKDLSACNVHNLLCDVGEYHFRHDRLDVAVLIDGALSYLYPCDPKLPTRVLCELQNRLVAGGKIVMEFDLLPKEHVEVMHREGRRRTWNKGDERDAFGYALYQVEPVDWDHMVFQNTSIYLPRTTAPEKVKQEIYKYYSTQELAALLDEVGFDVEYFGSFGAEAYTPQSKALIAVATKR